MPRTNWQDYPSTATPITAANLNAMEDRIDQALTNSNTAIDTAETAQDSIENLTDLQAQTPLVGTATTRTKAFIQAGSLVVTTNTSGVFNITFPEVFPNGLAAICLSNGDKNVGPLQIAPVNGTATKNGIQVVARATSNGAAYGSSLLRCNWIAVGW